MLITKKYIEELLGCEVGEYRVTKTYRGDRCIKIFIEAQKISPASEITIQIIPKPSEEE